MEINGGKISLNNTSTVAMGGTELMAHRLLKYVDSALLEDYQIVLSRVGKLDPSKIRIFWAHDLPGDPQSEFLKNGGWQDFQVFVFVSNWQMQQYIAAYGIPWSRSVVIENFIEPIEDHVKPNADPLNLIYFSTPHRGLDILVPVFEQLIKDGKNIHLDVYSSFGLYGWEERNASYEPLFDRCKEHPNIDYHGFANNDTIRHALKRSHVLAYPCIWPETSCLVLMEAMSAGLVCVHSNFAALPETASHFTAMYQFSEDKNIHAPRFYEVLKSVIDGYSNINTVVQKNFVDSFNSPEASISKWNHLLKSATGLDRTLISRTPTFNYSTN